jgi:molybdopterin/thiamine biosynthesis adenylyltransferase
MTTVTQRRDEAFANVGEFLRGLSGAESLSTRALGQYANRGFRVGWRFPVEFDGGIRRLDVLADYGFPRGPIRIALVDRPPFLTWPHVEKDGLLCLLPNSAQVDPSRPVASTQNILAAASQLIEDCIAGRNLDDFRDEFVSYWGWNADEGAPVVQSLVEGVGPSRVVRVWNGKSFCLIGETDEAVRTWLRHRFGSDLKHEVATDDALLVWLDKPLLPSDYPRVATDVRALIESRAPSISHTLCDLALRRAGRISVLLASPSENGVCLGGVVLSAPQAQVMPGQRRRGDPVSRGFRPSKVPAQIVTQRFFGTNPVLKVKAERVDAAWVHGRGQDSRADRLRTKTIAMLGVGALGSGVANTLAKAGVGRLVIVDPDRLSWANVGRHVLGASCVGQSKARALSDHIARELPHVRSVEPHERGWQHLEESNPRVIADVDLVVSTMADWTSEGALNAWHLARGRQNPIVYGWLEPHACAGHAVVVTASGGCLQCGFSPVGVPRLSVVDWPKAQQKQEPACGAVFQPYGPTELGHVVGLVAETALDALLDAIGASTHRIWAARLPLVESLNGQWNASWVSGVRDGVRGGLIDERPWAADGHCFECGTVR